MITIALFSQEDCRVVRMLMVVKRENGLREALGGVGWSRGDLGAHEVTDLQWAS